MWFMTFVMCWNAPDRAGNQPGFIFNLGHGMIPSAKIECVEALMEVVTGRKNA